jgi:hypothetical protein
MAISTHISELPEGFPEELRDKLRAAGKGWYAMYHWGTTTGENPVSLWFLNPWHQDDNNSGLFTLANLEAWAENKGPICKSSS